MTYTEAYKETGDAVAASILVLADALKENHKMLSDEICMGIRKGLFGAEAGNNASILDQMIVKVQGEEYENYEDA